MTNYREILRLQSLGINKTEIASSLHCARNTVAATLQRAGNCGLQWPLPDEMSDKQLAERLFPSAPGKPAYKMPDYAYVYREMQKSGVTLNLLWLEYCDQCKSSGEIPYQSTQFNKYYNDYLRKTNATMHLNHKPGEIMQVDWAGDTASVIDMDTGEVIPAYSPIRFWQTQFVTALSMTPTPLSLAARSPYGNGRAYRKPDVRACGSPGSARIRGFSHSGFPGE